MRDEEDIVQLLLRCRQRNREGQHALYRLYYGYAMSIATRYVQERDEAVSIVNDAFMKVYRHVKHFDLSKPFKPWFRTIIVNTALSHLKKHKNYRMNTEIKENELPPDREEILSRIGYEELIALVQSLSFAYRTVFNMYVIDGFKHEEIAQTLGITVSTSKSNLVRARRKLRELLQQQIAITDG